MNEKMNTQEFLKSGLLEQYMMGFTSEEKTQMVEHLIETNSVVRARYESLMDEVETSASTYPVGQLPVYKIKSPLTHKAFWVLMPLLLAALAYLTMNNYQLAQRNQQLQDKINHLNFRASQAKAEAPITADCKIFVQSSDSVFNKCKVNLWADGEALNVSTKTCKRTKQQITAFSCPHAVSNIKINIEPQ